MTHGVSYLPNVDHIIVLKHGRISEQGSYEDLLSSEGAFSDFIAEYLADMESSGEDAGKLGMTQLEQLIVDNVYVLPYASVNNTFSS